MTPEQQLLSLATTLGDSTLHGNETIAKLYQQAQVDLAERVDQLGNAYYLLSVVAAGIKQLEELHRRATPSEKTFIEDTVNTVLSAFNRSVQ